MAFTPEQEGILAEFANRELAIRATQLRDEVAAPILAARLAEKSAAIQALAAQKDEAINAEIDAAVAVAVVAAIVKP